MHPTEIPAFQAALGALEPGDLPVVAPGPSLTEEQADAATNAIATKISEAQVAGSPVTQCIAVLDALKDHVADLGASAANTLAGAAHLVLRNRWHQREDEADTIRDAARARIAVLEA